MRGFRVPQPLRAEVQRSLVGELLAADVRVVGLVAGSGLGKSVTMAQVARARLAGGDGVRVIWLRLNAVHADEFEFIRYLAAACLAALGEGVMRSSQQWFSRAGEHFDASAGARALSGDLGMFDGDIDVFIDETNVLNEGGWRALEAFASGLVEGQRLFFAAHELGVGFHRLRASGWFRQYGPDELRFSRDEVAQAIAGHELLRVDDVLALTQGMPIFVGHVASVGAIDRSLESMFDLQWERLQADLREILPSWSICDLWTTEALRALELPVLEGWEARLRLSGLMVSWEDGGCRPHSLLRDYLDARLALDQERYAELHARAADLAAGSRDWLQALYHANRIGDVDRIAVALRRCAWKAFNTKDYRLLDRLVSRLEPAVIEALTIVSFYQAVAHLRLGRREQADELLERLQLEPERVETHLVRALLFEEDARLSEAFEAYQLAFSILPPTGGMYYYVPLMSMRILIRLCRPEEAVAYIDKVFAPGTVLGSSEVSRFDFAPVFWDALGAACDFGRLVESLRACEAYYGSSEEWWGRTIFLMRWKAELLVATADTSAAWSLLERVRVEYEVFDSQNLYDVAYTASMILACNGEVAAADRWMQRSEEWRLEAAIDDTSAVIWAFELAYRSGRLGREELLDQLSALECRQPVEQSERNLLLGVLALEAGDAFGALDYLSAAQVQRKIFASFRALALLVEAEGRAGVANASSRARLERAIEELGGDGWLAWDGALLSYRLERQREGEAAPLARQVEVGLQTLGQPVFELDGQPVRLSAINVFVFLVYLAMSGPATKGRILSDLYSDVEPREANERFKKLVRRSREWLSGVLQVSPDRVIAHSASGYVLAGEVKWVVDAGELLSSADGETWLRLYRGSFMPLPGLADGAVWVENTRMELSHLAESVFSSIVESDVVYEPGFLKQVFDRLSALSRELLLDDEIWERLALAFERTTLPDKLELAKMCRYRRQVLAREYA